MSTTVYSLGIFYASVCTDDTDEEMLATINATHPTGVTPWVISDDKTFRSGKPNPSPCEHGQNKRHVLVEC